MDIGQALKVVQSFKPGPQAVSESTGEGGTAVDTAGFREVLVVLDCGTNEAGATADIKIQECATSDGQFADIDDAAFAQVTTGNDNAVYVGRIAMTPTRKRLLRAFKLIAVDTCALAVTFILGDATQLPAATPDFDVYD